MKSFAILALAAAALAQTSPPSGCQASRAGTFNIQTVNVTKSSTKRGLESRQLSGVLTISLSNGVLTDQAGRQGYIASNYQFQFNSGTQAGALQTSGFSVCSNGSLALSASGRASPAVWYSCQSGSFYNLYSQSTGAQCIPIYIIAVASTSGASQISDGQPQAPTPVSQISDGQPQAATPKPSGPVVSQISDGQPQAATPKPSGPVVSQISDGQPQAATPKASGPVVSQISDGQPQAATPKPVVTTPKPVGPVVSQISDGQPQAATPKASGPVVSQISDGQPQAPRPTGNVTRPNATAPAPSQFTGAATTGNAAVGGLVAGLFALFAML